MYKVGISVFDNKYEFLDTISKKFHFELGLDEDELSNFYIFVKVGQIYKEAICIKDGFVKLKNVKEYYSDIVTLDLLELKDCDIRDKVRLLVAEIKKIRYYMEQDIIDVLKTIPLAEFLTTDLNR